LTALCFKLVGKTPSIKGWLEGRVQAAFRPELGVELAGLHFPNLVGLAAGFDKNAELIDALPLLGFGSAEIGTVTPRPQKGNPRPRLFRIIENEAVLNRMGFNNDGADMVSRRLSSRRPTNMIVGGNIGKNKVTPNEEAQFDYRYCFKVLQDNVDYFTINVSSPNTPGLRQLLERQSLEPILEAVMSENRRRKTELPVFLKISPDMSEGALQETVPLCLEYGLKGIVATNTTIRREGLSRPAAVRSLGMGGLSGRPLEQEALNICKQLREMCGSKLVLLASGGIMDASGASQRWNAGADLLQVYTGLIYKGPDLILEMLQQQPTRHKDMVTLKPNS
jgi:dihydroorotate dehydrogenase